MGGATHGTWYLEKLYRYVPPHRVGFFLRRVGLKTGIHFAHFGEICEFEIDLMNFFVCTRI